MPMTLLGQFILTVEIYDLDNKSGQILLELSNDQGEKYLGVIQPLTDNKCIIIIENLKQGKYSFRYFHDENENENLDTNWLGIPKEGFGFSNNAEVFFSPPLFEKTIFEFEENMVLRCTPKYY